MFPRPSTRVPLVQIATLRAIIVYRAARSGCSAIAVHTLATPGVYTSRISCTVRTGQQASIRSLPPTWRSSARSWCHSTATPSSACISSAMRPAWSMSRTSIVMSLIECSRPSETVTTSPMIPSPSAIACATRASWPVWCGIWTR